VYSRAYFGPQRYDFLHTGSQGHSVPLIDGQTQLEGLNARAEVLETFPLEGGGLLYRLDLSKGYGVGGLTRLERKFLWTPHLNFAVLELKDTLESSRPLAFSERFVSQYRPLLESGKVLWKGVAGTLELEYDDTLLEPQLESIESQEHDGDPITVHLLTLEGRKKYLSQSFFLRFILSTA
jgi:hypothetical protein